MMKRLVKDQVIQHGRKRTQHAPLLLIVLQMLIHQRANRLEFVVGLSLRNTSAGHKRIDQSAQRMIQPA